MLTIRHMHYRQGTEALFVDAVLEVFRGQRVGLVGRNGCGKSTLLRLIMQELEPDQGTISLQGGIVVASVAQELAVGLQSVLDFTLDGDPLFRALESVLASGVHDEAYFVAQARFEALGGFAAPARASQLLAGLGFTGSDLQQPVGQLSGGWRMRLNLARALMSRADLLLLDEPTNHLDLEAIVWLEKYLASYEGALVIVSHDRDFLNAVVTRIAHIEGQKITCYAGDYDAFTEARALAMTQQQNAQARQAVRIAELERFVARFRAKASKASQAQSRLKMLERMERTAQVPVEAHYSFELLGPERAPDTLIQFDKVSFAYPHSRLLFSGVSLKVAPGDRIAVVGPNGAGKSTFLKILVGELAPSTGECRLGQQVRVGYFAQYQLEQLNPNLTPLEYLSSVDPLATTQALRNYLGRFGFGATSMDRPVGGFSGGEKSRLVLAGLAWRRPHILLLDEPTNHLDLDMRDSLMWALQDYQGALVLVSHDRHLIRACADTLWLVADGSAQVFAGDLADYQRSALLRQSERELRSEPKPARRTSGPSVKALAKQQQQMEKKMADIEARLAEIDGILAEPLIYQQGGDQARVLHGERVRLQAECLQYEEAWLALEGQVSG